MKCDKFDKCTKTDCGMCVDRGANMNEIRWTDKVYLDSQGNIRSSDGCSTELKRKAVQNEKQNT